MLYRVLAGLVLYLILPVIWVLLGVWMLVAPVRFTGFIDENVAHLPEARRGLAMQLATRVVGAGLIAFAVHFVGEALAALRK